MVELETDFTKMVNMYFLLCLWMFMVGAGLASTPNPSNEGYGDYGSCPLETNFYKYTCPEAEVIIFSWVERAISEDSRMAASLLRLHFHDCFVNGCDASVLLDDTQDFVGEKTAAPNLNSLRGFEVIDAIKSELESICPATVSCADILATVARDSVLLSGGPSWLVPMGRKDSFGASKAAANNNIPNPNSTLATLVTKFQNVGLSLKDVIALSGAHTIGRARCSSFTSRLQTSSNPSSPESNVDFIASLQQLCSNSDTNTQLAHLDLVTPATFDNQYYINLLSGEGLLPSDQALVSDDEQAREIVETYVEDPLTFFNDFKDSMLTMGSLGVLTGNEGEVRGNCRTVS